MSRAAAKMVHMKAIFRGGGLNGRAFTIEQVPPRGLDVEHDGRVLRYGHAGQSDIGEAIYVYSGRGAAIHRGPPVWLGGEFNATALSFYPRRPESPQRQFEFPAPPSAAKSHDG
jgi:hypothetical protein